MDKSSTNLETASLICKFRNENLFMNWGGINKKNALGFTQELSRILTFYLVLLNHECIPNDDF